MKNILFFTALLISGAAQAQSTKPEQFKKMYIDVHRLSGKVNIADVAAAHAKDLAVQSKYNTEFIKYWVDEKAGVIYCLSSAPDSSAVINTHREAHGLLPETVYQVANGTEAESVKNKTYFLDVHELGPNAVKAADVEKAHQKDLAVQKKYGVNLVNYWVDEQTGTVLCLSQASEASQVIKTHKEAHGLVPVSIMAVKQGQ